MVIMIERRRTPIDLIVRSPVCFVWSLHPTVVDLCCYCADLLTPCRSAALPGDAGSPHARRPPRSMDSAARISVRSALQNPAPSTHARYSPPHIHVTTRRHQLVPSIVPVHHPNFNSLPCTTATVRHDRPLYVRPLRQITDSDLSIAPECICATLLSPFFYPPFSRCWYRGSGMEHRVQCYGWPRCGHNECDETRSSHRARSWGSGAHDRCSG